MKAVLQRVKNARVEIEEKTVGACDAGLMILLGVCEGDTEEDASALAEKISKLRIFEDENGKMNLSVNDIRGSALVISNFTLCADYKKGNRPEYFSAAKPDIADKLYIFFSEELRRRLEDADGKVENGVFGADMQVYICNDGPVTIILDSAVILKK